MSEIVFPYIPNMEPRVKEMLLKESGLNGVDEIFNEIPDRLKFKGQMKIPEALLSEFELRKHVESLLAKNISCKEYLNFLGGGIWQHYVPAVCDTILSRDEFLTAYQREAYADRGKYQALFETASMIGELVNLDVVNVPTYDWANAIATSCRMAARINGRKRILVAGTISPARLLVIKNYFKPDLEIALLDYHQNTGLMDIDDLERKLTSQTAAVYFENPSYLGFIETQGKKISRVVHDYGAELIVGVDPCSLGILAPPPDYGADIVCGELQPFGIHMQWGGGLSGFIATPDEKKYVAEYPSLLYGITKTIKEGEYSFGKVYFERTSYIARERGKEFLGSSTALHAIIAGVYLALVGPKGLKELGEGIIQRVQYGRKVLSEINNVNAFIIHSPSFKEFVVNFNTPETVREINNKLKQKGIFGGKEIKKEFPQYGNSALYCITEIHTKEDIDRLACAIEDILHS